MRIVGKRVGIDLSDEGLLIEVENSRDFIQLDPEQAKELFIFLEMIKTGTAVVVLGPHKQEEETEHDHSGQGYM